MKRIILGLVLVLASALLCGCMKESISAPTLSDANEAITEDVICECITWENVLIESWD